MHWRILADDLTGALDSAAAFAGAGEVPVWLHAPAGAPPALATVQAVCTGSRDIPGDALAGTLGRTLPWFTQPGAAPHIAFKKIDSLLRGNSLAEVAWLAQHGGFDGVVFAPAFPAQGRFTRDGQHAVGLPHRPNAPGHQPCGPALADAFQSLGCQVCTGTADASALPAPGQVWVPDVLDDRDLDRLAALTRHPEAARWLWCGSAGLAGALARHWSLASAADAGADSLLDLQMHTPHALAVTASRHPVLRTQLQQLPEAWALAAHTAPADVGGTAPMAARGPLVLDLAAAGDLAPALAEQRLKASCDRIVALLGRPSALVVVGGDTLLALCEASGATRMLAAPAPMPGWGRARFDGGLWHGLTCFSRSGAFGAPDDFARLLQQLTPFTFKDTPPCAIPSVSL